MSSKLAGLAILALLLLSTAACVSRKPAARAKVRRTSTQQVSQTEERGPAAEQQQQLKSRRLVAKRTLLSAEEITSVERIVLSLSADATDEQGRESKSTIEFDHDKHSARYERRWRNPAEKTNGVYCSKVLSTADYDSLIAALQKAKLASFPDEEEPDPDPANCLSLILRGRGPQIYSFAESGRRTRCASESLTILGGSPLLKMAHAWKSCPK